MPEVGGEMDFLRLRPMGDRVFDLGEGHRFDYVSPECGQVKRWAADREWNRTGQFAETRKREKLSGHPLVNPPAKHRKA
jgi:hypothetical protein